MSIRPLPEQIEAVDVVEGDSAVMQGTGEVVIESVQILDADAHPRQRFQTNEDLVVSSDSLHTSCIEKSDIWRRPVSVR